MAEPTDLSDAPRDESVPDAEPEVGAEPEIVGEPEVGVQPEVVGEPEPVIEPEPVAVDDESDPIRPYLPDIPVVAGTATGRGHQPFKRRRTWSQRLLLALNIVVILACFGVAVGLVIGRHVGNSLAKVDLESPSPGAVATTVPVLGTTSPAGTTVEGGTLPAGVTSTLSTAPTETFPAADPTAQNFLITGADNNSCIDPNSPYAGAFGDRSSSGERSDTVMIMRVDPATKQAAVLSFPRDLWVTIAGRNSKQRINTAYVKDDPQKLVDTIVQNFQIGVDHYIQIDFCAFKTIVDSIGGVGVPFEYPTRDSNTGLNITDTGCHTFDGDEALAYVRSRHYQYFVNGTWKTDGVSDLGRISRQQDFLRRVLTAALNKGLINPSVVSGLISAAQNNVVVDNKLTISKMLEFVGVLRDIQPGGIATYQIEATNKTIQGNAVLIPNLKSANMQEILHIFQGIAPLANAPEQVFETTTVPTSEPSGSTTTVASETTIATETTVAGPDENTKGIVPPRDVTC